MKQGAVQTGIGLAMVGVLLLAAIAGPALAPYAMDYSEKVVVLETEQGPTTLYAPQPPSWRHLLGTDRWGYDVLSLLLYGARYTVLAAVAIAFLRVAIGGALGLGLGMWRDVSSASPMKGSLGAIPAFVVVYLVMVGISIDSPLGPSTLAAIEGGLIVLLGIPAVAATIGLKTAQHRKSHHVFAAVALGAGRGRIARRHILPLLREDLLVLYVAEMVLALVLIGQLAVFDLFFGGTVLAFDPILLTPKTPEWASMVGAGRTSIQAHRWIALAPLGAFAFTIVAFQMLASGLERRVRTGYARYPLV